MTKRDRDQLGDIVEAVREGDEEDDGDDEDGDGE